MASARGSAPPVKGGCCGASDDGHAGSGAAAAGDDEASSDDHDTDDCVGRGLSIWSGGGGTERSGEVNPSSGEARALVSPSCVRFSPTEAMSMASWWTSTGVLGFPEVEAVDP